jgi:hypothetical protein
MLPAMSSGSQSQASPREYRRRRPEETILYDTVRAELETFLGRAEAAGRRVPKFVERELRAYLACGIPAHGFVHVHCDTCGHDRVVAFSCKGRAFCPSCGGRRMAETAAFLVDQVLPRVPVRQWVLSLPIALRYRLGCDSKLTASVLQVFVRAVFASLRRRGRRRWGRGAYACGGITFVQRFGDALNLNVHFHSLLLDGVYARSANGRPRFCRLPPPTTDEVERVTRRIVARLRRLLLRRGLGPDRDVSDADPLHENQPLLAELYAASVRNRSALAERRAKALVRIGSLMDPEEQAIHPSSRSASIDGVSLHANVSVPAGDRRRLEMLCRYVARPPVSTQRLSRLEDGRLLYRLKKTWRDGTTHVVFEPGELLERLVAIIPPPRMHVVRYHGVLAARFARRREIVADAQRPRRPDRATPHRGAKTTRKSTGKETSCQPRCERGDPGQATGRRWIPWRELMRRVFALDVLECPRCKASMTVVSVAFPPDATKDVLDSLALPARAPPLEPSRLVTADEPPDRA